MTALTTFKKAYAANMIDFFEMVPSISISSVIYDAPLLTTIGCL
jgi:hypothetical protein